MKQFNNRSEAGRQLAALLREFKSREDVVVLGLPRGGVVTAFEIAQELDLPLDIVVPRKIGAPGQEELAVGALTEDGSMVLNESLMRDLGITMVDIADTIAIEKKEAERRLKLYRGDRPPLDLINTTAILVDDGIATGATMRAAIKSARQHGAKKIVVAVPMSPTNTIEQIGREVDQVVCLLVTDMFWAIGQFYKTFEQVSDDEVIGLLHKEKLP
jgi:putative phosphoribosyl transferase